MNQPVQTSGTAVASLVIGIASWVVLPIIGAIAAIICGHVARGEIRRLPPGSIEGNGMALAGLILGYSQLAIAGLLFSAFIFFALAFNGLIF